jgi:hypothetical protein
MDNSGFEMYKLNKPMYEPSKLITMADRIKADYIVMTDYPAHDSEWTIKEAEKLAPQFKDAGYKTFFVPQGAIGNIDDLLYSFVWASTHPELIDYIGVSILSAPLAYDVESGNKLQRFVSRLRLMYDLRENGILANIARNQQKIHMLGMVDGPNEILFMEPFAGHINTWDSSAAVWAGLNGLAFDETPTGLRDGKFEEEVDFSFETSDSNLIECCEENMRYIDMLCQKYHGEYFEV